MTSQMQRILIMAALLFAMVSAAHAIGLGLGGRFGHLGASSGAGTTTPLPTGSALLVDNSNPALLVDNTNPACIAGGC